MITTGDPGDHDGDPRDHHQAIHAITMGDPRDHDERSTQEALGYQDVAVTKPANDKGVDVTARIELGITDVQEVVKAKRQKANVQRTVLDSLRGSLHRWRAVRGTIISTSNFSKGALDAAFEHGAAPITLIDGEKLLDLLIENDIGVSKRKVEVWDLDADAFAGGEDVLEEEPG